MQGSVASAEVYDNGTVGVFFFESNGNPWITDNRTCNLYFTEGGPGNWSNPISIYQSIGFWGTGECVLGSSYNFNVVEASSGYGTFPHLVTKEGNLITYIWRDPVTSEWKSNSFGPHVEGAVLGYHYDIWADENRTLIAYGAIEGPMKTIAIAYIDN